MKERKALMDDAQHATKAALEEGIVPGGGVALLRSEKALDKLDLTGDEALGATIIRKVLDAPLRAIAENAGSDGAVVVNRVRQMKGNATTATTPIAASIATWSRQALSTRPRSCARRCKTPPAWPRCC